MYCHPSSKNGENEQAPAAKCGIKALDTNDFIFLFGCVKQH
ncbi:hypothetical protein PVL29_011020 [Vitis rotundifolia]|uniref:Uncharacterized protein n=1 Tax=Vitis rotundifolia TaxID=103349 RepID=A0AA39DUA2_VITRO|nr:hypothetical protein PVL29_011020 [Vitis rotundifolia]